VFFIYFSDKNVAMILIEPCMDRNMDGRVLQHVDEGNKNEFVKDLQGLGIFRRVLRLIRELGRVSQSKESTCCLSAQSDS